MKKDFLSKSISVGMLIPILVATAIIVSFFAFAFGQKHTKHAVSAHTEDSFTVADDAESSSDELKQILLDVDDIYRKDKITVETKQKVHKIKAYISENPEFKSLEESYIKMTSVFGRYDIPINQNSEAWEYYNSIKGETK